MSILESIKQSFANLQKNQSLYLEKYNARTFMFEDGTYGVGIPFNGDTKINEKFANVKLYSYEVVLEDTGKSDNYLLLTSSLIHMRNEFALVCADFVEPGKENENREGVLEDPFSWWKRWRELLGNAVKNPKVHSIIGEMAVVKYLKMNGKDAKWNPLDFATHDIETNNEAFEVKSTTSKYEQIISVNSQFQLSVASGKTSLLFCRFEKSRLGESINSLIQELANYGFDKHFLNHVIDEMGYPEGSSARDEQYQLLEMRRYTVDDGFPGSDLRNYIREMADPSVKSVTYDIDLSGINFNRIEI